MYKQIKLTLILIISMASSSIDAKNTASSINELQKQMCESIFAKELKDFLTNGNSELMSQLYQLAQMKLAQRVLSTADGDRQKSLEAMIKRKANQISKNGQDFEAYQKVHELYKKHGKTLTTQEVQERFSQMEKAKYGDEKFSLKGVDAAVVVSLLRHSEKSHCSEYQSPQGVQSVKEKICLNETDESILWMVGQMNNLSGIQSKNQKFNMEPSTIIAHYTGHALKNKKDLAEQALTHKEINAEIHKINENINKEISNFENIFYSEYDKCEQFFGTGECFAKKVRPTIPRAIQDLNNFFLSDNAMDSLANLSADGNLVIGNVRVFAGLNETFQDKVREHQAKRIKEIAEDTGTVEELVGTSIAWEEEEIKMCGSHLFKSEVRNVNVFGLDPQAIKSGKIGTQNAKTFGKTGMDGMRAANTDANEKSKLGRFANKFHIPGPMFRCSNDPVRTPPTFSFKSAEKLTCCDEKEEWRKMYYAFANFSVGVSCRAFVGVPFIAELGVKVGTGVTVNLGGGSEPENCGADVCGQGTVSFNVSAALYGEIGSGAATVQGTVSWVPFASIRQCGLGKQNKPSARFTYKVGVIMFHGTIKAGWLATYETSKVLYSNDKNVEHDIAIF